MPGTILDEDHIHPAIRERIARENADIVEAVRTAISSNKVISEKYFCRPES